MNNKKNPGKKVSHEKLAAPCQPGTAILVVHKPPTSVTKEITNSTQTIQNKTFEKV